MQQEERRRYLIGALLRERGEASPDTIPTEAEDQRRLLRALMNVRPPAPVSRAFLQVQDAYLQELLKERGVTCVEELRPVEEGVYLWRGDITTLRCGAIVNAANSGMTGCYQPCHGCIDNAIHTYAGVQLRLKCAGLMARQGHEEPVGRAKITPACNLPCDYVIHTVGPMVQGRLTGRHCEQLEACYRACLQVAEENGVASIAFCCISTGVFMFPGDRAAEIAVRTVRRYLDETGSGMKVIFNVFREEDERIYRRLLGEN
ncbi:MAG: protein-ADP-ribose hydrolase [Aristaeellaceae bacterium]